MSENRGVAESLTHGHEFINIVVQYVCYFLETTCVQVKHTPNYVHNILRHRKAN